MNIWEHVKLAGGVVCVIGAFTGRPSLTFLGFIIFFIGVSNHVAQLEYRMKLLEKGERNEETDSEKN